MLLVASVNTSHLSRLTCDFVQTVEPNGELGFTMVFQSRATPYKMWVEPERVQKYVNFFGPGVDAEVRFTTGGGRETVRSKRGHSGHFRGPLAGRHTEMPPCRTSSTLRTAS